MWQNKVPEVDGSVDTNTRVDISKFRDSGQESATVLVNILLSAFPVPFSAGTTATAAGNSQT